MAIPNRSHFFGLSLGLVLYLLSSYLLLLRDDFILERLSVALKLPSILTTGRFLAAVTHANWTSIILLTAGLLVSFWFYFQILRHASAKSPLGINQRGLIYLISINCLISLLSFPILSTDVFDYINTNRVAFVHHQNPWVTPPQAFPEDGLIYFGSWNFRASVYPPLMFVLSSTIYLLAGSHILLNLLGFKLLSLLFYLLILVVLRRAYFKPISLPFLFFALNPLVLIEFLGNAHHDLVMGFFALLAFYYYKQHKFSLSGIYLGLGFLAKFTVVLYLPVFLASLFISRNHRANLVLGISFLLIIFIGLAPLASSLIYLANNLAVQFQLYLQSLPTIIRYLFGVIFKDDATATALQKAFSLPGLALVYGLTFHRFKPEKIVSPSVILMLMYLIFFAPMLQPWYLAWLLPIVPLARSKNLITVTAIFSASLMAHYIVKNLSFYLDPLNFSWQIILYLTMVAPPLLYLYCSRWRPGCYTRLLSLINRS